MVASLGEISRLLIERLKPQRGYLTIKSGRRVLSDRPISSPRLLVIGVVAWPNHCEGAEKIQGFEGKRG